MIHFKFSTIRAELSWSGDERETIILDDNHVRTKWADGQTVSPVHRFGAVVWRG